jgi:Protein of unknown function (DUF3106)
MPLLARLLTLASLCAALATWPAVAMAQTHAASAPQAPAHSLWKQLHAREKVALAPLAAQWAELTPTQRSKWLAIAQQFDKLSSAEQHIMQGRMKEWVALGPVQRNQARLNFNTVQSLSKDEKKSRWDEYQSLSEDEKRRLSAGTLAPAKTTAPSRTPVGSDRLVQPTVRSVPSAALPPRAPIDQKTLLPLPPPAADPPPAAAANPNEAASEATGS